MARHLMMTGRNKKDRLMDASGTWANKAASSELDYNSPIDELEHIRLLKGLLLGGTLSTAGNEAAASLMTSIMRRHELEREGLDRAAKFPIETFMDRFRFLEHVYYEPNSNVSDRIGAVAELNRMDAALQKGELLIDNVNAKQLSAAITMRNTFK
jgi:hypothetical protein